ncbi:unnamed protein product [Macrosiphum euphorbiae]|uniref:Uncharacterized protein n=1 Tax=Macrosiphum euphorbiae TaxID=13131 RepID=A0AAV0WA09_9HEMI|nr:unnamed protein product [Macrosiphum euphorbiae]
MENETDEKKMENSNGNVRKGKSVTFNQDTQVFVFDSEPNDFGESNARQTAQGCVRERVKRYNQNVAWRSIPLRSRPPALPPRNPVQVNVAGPTPLPPKPPPRAKNEPSVVANVRPKVRIFRRCPDTRPVTEAREVEPLVPHYRMKVPDTPPPPPPSLVRSSAATISTSSAATISTSSAATISTSSAATISTSSAPSGPSDDDDNGIRLADDQRYNAEGTTAADADDENNREDRPGWLTGCFLFIVSCFSCT